MEKNETVRTGDGFVDRSKVRILLCDNDAKSSEEVFTLLCKCSYQVISVRSPRQVIDALNAEGPHIDLILSEVDLPMSKGFKMLKYIMRDKQLRRIPVIMMSSQDEVSIVFKCLKFGAADYLVKPLRTNELLNLWTHMWRRRRMLGLAEKNILSYDFNLVVSEPSDPNTNSTTLLSDDTDDKSRKCINPEMCPSTMLQEEARYKSIPSTDAAPVETAVVVPFEQQPDAPGTDDQRTGEISLFPKKSELKIGECSAFFTYVKSSLPKSNGQSPTSIHGSVPQQLGIEEKTSLGGHEHIDTNIQVTGDVESHLQGDGYPKSNNIPKSLSIERSCTPPLSQEFPHHRNSKMEEFSQVHMHLKNEAQHGVSSFHAQTPYPYYISGVMNQVMMPSTQIYHESLQHLHNHANSAMLPQYNYMPQYPHMHGISSYPFYPIGMCFQPGQLPAAHPWHSFGSSSSAEIKVSKVDPRETALMKFRQKRKERCFDKKIRYINRKQLAEQRPRLRGQFVRKANGVNVDVNGQPSLAGNDDVEEEEEEEVQIEYLDSSHEDDL
ncbi:two-component response regulator-like APRR1 [Solanum stenotomum]|uniref:two-component response regulator-like APRR1 n=1 Tax=Solanum stenotomum TaxID=172797 RepID=UPI0020D17DEE|nr:two-component response regulator-like APRR1 [Solanum stenotomum]